MSTSNSAAALRLALGLLVAATSVHAQAADGYRDRLTGTDLSGVVVTIAPHPVDETIDESSQRMLNTRMGSVLSRGGLAGVGVVTPFAILPRVAVVDDRTVEIGVEPRVVARIELAFSVVHLRSRSRLHEWSGTFTGTGRTRSAAVRSALAELASDDPRLAAFAQETRTRIVSYYERNCTAIRRQAAALAQAGSLEEAHAELLAVPGDAGTCQRAAATDAERLAERVAVQSCERSLREARAEMAAGNLSEAAEMAGGVEGGTTCGRQADALLGEIDERARAREDRSLQLRLGTIRRERVSSNASRSLVSRGREHAASFFNRTEARTIRFDLIR